MLLLHVGEMAVVCGGGSEASILQNAGRKNSKVWLVVLAWYQGAFPGVFSSPERSETEPLKNLENLVDSKCEIP